MGRKALFGSSLRLSFGPVWNFSDSLRRGLLGNWASGAEDSRKLNIYYYSC